MHIRGIEFISIDSPGFVEHLGPLGSGLDRDRDRRERGKRAVSLVELARIDDSRDLAGAIENLLVIRGEVKIADAVGQRLLLAGLQIEPAKRRLPLSFLDLRRSCSASSNVVDLPLGAGGQRGEQARLDGQGDDSLGDSVQIDETGLIALPADRLSLASLSRLGGGSWRPWPSFSWSLASSLF